jgi:hypothetical protein
LPALYLYSWSKHIFLVQSVLFQVFYKHLLRELTGEIWNHSQGFILWVRYSEKERVSLYHLHFPIYHKSNLTKIICKNSLSWLSTDNYWHYLQCKKKKYKRKKEIGTISLLGHRNYRCVIPELWKCPLARKTSQGVSARYTKNS